MAPSFPPAFAFSLVSSLVPLGYFFSFSFSFYCGTCFVKMSVPVFFFFFRTWTSPAGMIDVEVEPGSGVNVPGRDAGRHVTSGLIIPPHDFLICVQHAHQIRSPLPKS